MPVDPITSPPGYRVVDVDDVDVVVVIPIGRDGVVQASTRSEDVDDVIANMNTTERATIDGGTTVIMVDT